MHNRIMLNDIFAKKKLKTTTLFLLSLLSGLLLSSAWLPNGFAAFIFIGFVPLLLVEKAIYNAPEKYNGFVLIACGFLAFFTWNIVTTWWIKNASFGGAALAILCSSVFMTIVYFLFHKIKNRIGEKWGYLIFCSCWITWEYFDLHWDLSWPWLMLGNAFADNISWIQWYEYTGVFGGTLWVLVANSLIASCFISTATFYKFRFDKRKIIPFGLLLLPLAFSFFIVETSSLSENNEAMLADAVIVQPNIDPYHEKFSGPPEEQLRKMLALAAEKVDSNTAYLFFPETALVEDTWEDELNQDTSIILLKTFLREYPQLTIIVGASTSKSYEPGETRPTTARKFTSEDGYYDSYNTALQLDTTATIQLYHKSRLVPGVEKLPFPLIFGYLGDALIDFGGTSGTLGSQEERGVFTSAHKPLKIAPVICYESVYGEYVGDYMRNGANFIAILTNDGWWGDTPGYIRHLKYAGLRAIETRSWVARSANTGISCFITPKGEILQPTKWWEPAVIKGKIGIATKVTFYTRYGDYIAKAAMYLAFLLVIYSWLIRFHVVKK